METPRVFLDHKLFGVGDFDDLPVGSLVALRMSDSYELWRKDDDAWHGCDVETGSAEGYAPLRHDHFESYIKCSVRVESVQVPAWYA